MNYKKNSRKEKSKERLQHNNIKLYFASVYKIYLKMLEKTKELADEYIGD
jgi:hypothetical protein